MAKKHKYIVRVTVVTVDKKTRAEVRHAVQLALDEVCDSTNIESAKAGAVDLQ